MVATTLSRISSLRPRSPHNPRVYYLTFLSCLGSWMFGYNNGVIAGVLVLPSFYRDFNLPTVGTKEYNNVTGNIVSLLQIGGLVGSLGTFGVMKYWGRRGAMIASGAVYLVGAVMQTFCHGGLPLMFAGRFFSGIGTGGATVVVPLYIAELAPPSIRGSLVGIYEINNQLSSLMGYWCNYIVNEYIPSISSRQWQIPLAVQIVPSALLILAAIFILPESPRLLVKKGNKLQARKNLAWVRKLDPDHELVNREMREIEDAIRMQNTPPPRVVHRHSGGKLGLFKELCWKGNRERVLIALGLMFGQNLTGIQGVNFYTPTVFKSIGFDGTKVVLLASGMFAAVKTIATILSLSFFIDRLGRRKLLLTSSVGTSLALWYIGAFVTAKHIDLSKPQEKSVAGWIAIVCVYIYAAFFSFAWNGVVWVYCAEIFPIRIKELAACICTATQWLSQFAIARASPTMLTEWKGGFFFFFASCLVVMGSLVFWLVPETKGKTLERMDDVFGSAYGDVVEVELGNYRREGREKGIFERGKAKPVDEEGGVAEVVEN
ncbi:general substrate transporter [Hyaloscypha sp. PMI_1271]|nr:general substrate transporter [Hyaloscypha sp. PMI_1271]